MHEKFRNYLEGTIHGDDHLGTVYDRIRHLVLMKEAIEADNPTKAKEELKSFYQYIAHDHENYHLPDNLIESAKARTHFFHGLVYAHYLTKIKKSVFAYSLSLVHIEMINEMTDPNKALELTCAMMDTYEDFTQNYLDMYTNVGTFSTQVLDLIDINITENITTSSIADILCIHPDYLQKKFKKETGYNVTEVINIRKIDLAKLYLRSSDYSITKIAFELGFSDASYFGKVFRRYEEITPSEFRKNYNHA